MTLLRTEKRIVINYCFLNFAGYGKNIFLSVFRRIANTAFTTLILIIKTEIYKTNIMENKQKEIKENALRIIENRIILNAVAKCIEPELFQSERERAIEIAEFFLKEKKIHITKEQFKEIAKNILLQSSDYLYLNDIFKKY